MLLLVEQSGSMHCYLFTKIITNLAKRLGLLVLQPEAPLVALLVAPLVA